jgi:hypothetical protein
LEYDLALCGKLLAIEGFLLLGCHLLSFHLFTSGRWRVGLSIEQPVIVFSSDFCHMYLFSWPALRTAPPFLTGSLDFNAMEEDMRGELTLS